MLINRTGIISLNFSFFILEIYCLRDPGGNLYKYQKKTAPEAEAALYIDTGFKPAVCSFTGLFSLNSALHHPVKTFYELGRLFELLTFNKHCLLEEEKAYILKNCVV